MRLGPQGPVLSIFVFFRVFAKTRFLNFLKFCVFRRFLHPARRIRAFARARCVLVSSTCLLSLSAPTRAQPPRVKRDQQPSQSRQQKQPSRKTMGADQPPALLAEPSGIVLWLWFEVAVGLSVVVVVLSALILGLEVDGAPPNRSSSR